MEDKSSDLDPEVLDQLWDGMTPEEREMSLAGKLELELDRLEAGELEPSEYRLSRLASRLSALRAELYGTPEGQARYRRMETRLEALEQ
jgi:hypothetical protein